MEELAGPSEPTSDFVFKTIHSTNFRCVTCRKAFRSEFGVKTHLKNNHGIADPSVIHYEPFVGVRRVKVPKEPSIEREAGDPSIDNTSIPGVSYDCSMCEKVYHSFEGMKGHLLSSHGITRPVNSELFKYNLSSSSNKPVKTIAKPVIRFVTPTIENKKIKNITAQQSQIHQLVEKKVEKTHGFKRKHEDESPKDKKKPKTYFCKSLNNMFTSGNIQMRSLNLWSKKEKETTRPCQNNTQEIRHSERFLSQTRPLEDKSDQSQNDLSYCLSGQSQNIIPQSHNMGGQSQASFPPSLVSSKTNSQNNFNQSQISFDLSQTIHTKKSQNDKKKISKVKAERKKKICNDPECRLRGPCSEEDCGICQFCQNKNLKNKCVRRRCPNLNIRVVKGAEDEILNDREHDDTDNNENNAFNSTPIQTDPVVEVYDKFKFIVEIVEEVINAVPEKNVQRVMSKKKEKRYPCDKCGKLFSQYATSKKHCVVKRSEDLGAVCPICGKKLEKKRNLKRHISKVHDPNKSYNHQNKPAPGPIKCPDCGKEYSARNKLVEHRQSKHGLGRKAGQLFNCPECDFVHYSMSRLKAHVTVTHSTQEANVFSCSICNIIYKSASGLQKHKRSVHGNVPSSVPSLPDLPPSHVVAKKSKPPPIENTQGQVSLDVNEMFVNSCSEVGNMSKTTSCLSTAQEDNYPSISDIIETDMSIINSRGHDSDIDSFPKANFQFQMDNYYIESELSYHQL